MHDQNVDKVWVKLMPPPSGILQKRRRSKYYEYVLKAVANQNGYIFYPDEVMIGFEIA